MHQQQVGDVGAGNQQHEGDGSEERDHRTSHVADHHLGEGAHDDGETAEGIGGRVSSEDLVQRLELARGLLNRHAGAQPADESDLALCPTPRG